MHGGHKRQGFRRKQQLRNTQPVSHRCRGLSQHSRGHRQCRMDGAGSSLCVPTLVPPVPVCPLCTGTRAWGSARALFAEGMNLRVHCQGKGARPSACTQIPLPEGDLRPLPMREAQQLPGHTNQVLSQRRAALSSSRPSHMFPALSLPLSSALSQAIPFPACPQAACVPETPSRACSMEGHGAEQEQGDDP